MTRRDRKQGLTLLAGLGIGAALMFVLDPRRGAARRAEARDRGASTLRTAGERVGGRARRLRDRATGAVRGRWNRRREGIVPDETLVARVRSHLGHHVQHPHAIEVTARDGVVTLRGTVPIDELERAIIAARDVSGVTLVESELDVLGASTAFADYDGAG